jgi:hypothetical protein
MRRRRTTTELGSLELLLDTICNTFGGIIFLAILVAVLLQFSGAAKQSDAKAGPTSSSDTVAEEVAAARRAIARQNELIASLERSVSTAPAGDIPQLKKQLADAIEPLHLREQISSLESRLRAEAELRTREARLPMLHETTKTNIPLVLKDHRLMILLKPDAARSFNEADFDKKPSASGQHTFSPRPAAGIPVASNNFPIDRIATALAGFNPTKEYLGVFLWEDSFDAFAALRTLMVSKGFEYRLVPVPARVNAISEGASAGQVQ